MEAHEVRSLALRLDLCNQWTMHQNLPPDTGRSSYPLGYGPGQMLKGPDRAAVAAYVDAA
jgi:hypothetical protein